MARKFQNYKVSADRYYQALKVLSCDSGHTLEQCREEFTSLAKRYHPDAVGGDKNRFIQIRQAYEEIEMYLKEKEEVDAMKDAAAQGKAKVMNEDYESKERREREFQAAMKAYQAKMEESRAEERRQEEERRAAYERYRDEQRQREQKNKVKVELDDELRHRREEEAKAEARKKARMQKEEQERLARESADRLNALEKAREEAAERQERAEKMRQERSAGPSKEDLERARQEQLRVEQEREQKKIAAEKEELRRRQEAMRVNIRVTRGRQGNDQPQAQPKFTGTAPADASEQSSSGSFAGVALLLVFAGAGAAFTGGALKLSDEEGGPTKHTVMDVENIQNSVAAADSSDGDQKKKVLLQQEALRKKLQIKSQKRIEQQLKSQMEAKLYSGPIRRKYDGSGSQQRRLDALKNRKVIETDPEKMKTYPRIPFQRSISLRPRATPMEAERFFQLNFEQDLDDWIKKGFATPSLDELSGVLNETTLKKLDCLPSSRRCSGLNKKVYSGEFEQCGKLAPFYLWKRFIDETEYEEDVLLFMDQYKIDPFVVPKGAEESMNRFFQSRYGLFTCQDSQEKFGEVEIDPFLIQKWEGNDEQRKRIWTLAVLYALDEGTISVEMLGQYRQNFKDGKKFQKYLKTHPNHEAQLIEQKSMEIEKNKSIFKKKMAYEDFLNFNTEFLKEWI